MTEKEFDRKVGVYDLSNERRKAALQRIGERNGKRWAEERERRAWSALLGNPGRGIRSIKGGHDPEWRSWKFFGIEVFRVRAVIKWWTSPSWHVHFGKFRKRWVPAGIRIGPVRFCILSWRPRLPVGTMKWKVELNDEGGARITFL
ncbi:MAG: hypothetical protein KAJ19_12650 [Gammaproteobacteria bacterium]|nr:hypothetical protein [Gammaproteobacteria bacterium]